MELLSKNWCACSNYEPTLIQTFVTHLPKELVPLARLSPGDPTTVEVFAVCINGREIAPGCTAAPSLFR